MRNSRTGSAARALVLLCLGASQGALGGSSREPPASSKIPLCPGLQIVTAVNQPDGDYESIKTVESVSDAGVRIKYSSERMVSDWLSSGPPKLQRPTSTVRCDAKT